MINPHDPDHYVDAAAKAEEDFVFKARLGAEVRVTIEKLLDQGLPRVYAPKLFEQKTSAVFQHVYDAYYGAGRSLYAAL